ncbi:PREDICTED: uncharacterized protein LOC109154501 [Ipomoea nil]|uniref:uncharacterized protein LOC109154501 n=1 Tax=Ipomoea nil TaxID=35883 RepID=UPI000901C041|nr:PREDICTED: uncharacterized protein LOC109154501 [Ipomoea nil]
MKHTVDIWLYLLAIAREQQSNRGRVHTLLVCLNRMFMDFLESLYLVHLDCRERLLEHMDRVFLEMVVELQVVGTTMKIKNHSVGISLEAECRGGMIQQQQQISSSEEQIPESSCAAIIVGLNRSIDAKGNSSSSSKAKDTISRWQKDNGITREVLELLLDKSRGDDSKIHMLCHIHSREHAESLALALALDAQISREKAPIPLSAKKKMYKLLRSIREVNHVLLCRLKNSKVISPCP